MKCFSCRTSLWLLAITAATGLVLLLPAYRSAVAQSTISGDISGTITDPTGAAIPGAKVTITNAATGAAQTVISGGSGEYHVGLLQPGAYKVSASATNFRTTQASTTVAVGQTSSVNLRMSVSQANQTVEVEASSVPLLQTENSDVATTITQQQVQNLPNPGGDITYYVNLTQGVVMNTAMGYGNGSAFGLPATSNNFTVNGAEDNDPFLNLNNSGPSNLLLGQDDVAEVNVVANAYSAQYGALGGVQENIITRSGSNQFHGNATWYWTNSDMNANNWFNDNTGAPEPYANANQWGAALGGPIKKDKTFFFANYEGLRFVTSPVDAVFLPTTAYQMNPAGTVSSTTNSAGGAETLVTNPSVLGNDGACDNKTSSLYASGNAAECSFYKRMFELYNAAPRAASAAPVNPLATATTNCLTTDAAGHCTFANSLPAGYAYQNYLQESPKNFLPESLFTMRVDQRFGANDTAFVHFKYDHGVQPTYVDPINPAFNAQSDQPDYEGQLVETHTFSPNLVNQFIMSGMWYSAYFLNVNAQKALATFPYELDIVDGSFTNLGNNLVNWPEGRNVTQYQVNDDLDWTHGKHTVSFGLLFKRDDVTDADLGILSIPLGVQIGPAEGPFSGGDTFSSGSMLEGIQRFPQRLSEPIRLYNLGIYAQDRWQVTPRTQVSAGVRLEHNSDPVCVTNCMARLTGNYNSISAGLGTPYKTVIQSGQSAAFPGMQRFMIDPRLGFTFSASQHTVVRGGFGMFTDIFPATIADSMLTNAPLNVQFNSLGALADPAQPGNFISSMAASNVSFKSAYAAGGSFNSISVSNPGFSAPAVVNPDASIQYPTYAEWSLQVEEQVGPHTSVQVGYVGNHGFHEPVVNNSVNVFGFGSAPAAPQLPAFSQVTEVQSKASSNYNGLVAGVREQGKIFTGQLNYTWSHALDEISNGGILPFNSANSTSPIDPFNLKLNYGNADYDTPQSINGNVLVKIPKFRGPALLTDNWQIGDVIFWNTGFPFSVTDGSLSSGLNANNYFGTLLAQPTAPVPQNCGKSAVAGLPGSKPCFGAPIGGAGANFSAPTDFVPGRNHYFGPHFFDTDLNVQKGFHMPGLENSMFFIGAQAYNVLNHTNFANPISDASSPNFGTIVSAVSPPTSVFGSFLGGSSTNRIIQLKANFTF
ncbi:MAG: carboxypeptidase regulatory-like domain-containing protein [Acidobacteriota bacterium]